MEEEWHLDIYSDRSVFHNGDKKEEFKQGRQSPAAKKRYDNIVSTLKDGYLDNAYIEATTDGRTFNLDKNMESCVDKLVSSITSEEGRGLTGLTFIQLTVKSIQPDQSVRLHKGNSRKGYFSWEEGISMRSLDKKYITPFLRKKNLLKMNNDGNFMTRTLAENYPYTLAYKAQIKGPVDLWMDVVDTLEAGNVDARELLLYMIRALNNNQIDYLKKCENLHVALRKIDHLTFEEAVKINVDFYSTPNCGARPFEIAIHSFMQACEEMKMLDGKLSPLTQMRSANKKHKNVGDAEVIQGNAIVEAWDGKFCKVKLSRELLELEEKITSNKGVRTAGFITDKTPEIDDDCKSTMQKLKDTLGVDVSILQFEEWVNMKISKLDPEKYDEFAKKWITATVESLIGQRPEKANIDEPSKEWIVELTAILDKARQ